MDITLNGAPQHTAARNLQDLLIAHGFGGKVATARNGEFVPVALRETTPIQHGDRIEVLAAMQGG